MGSALTQSHIENHGDQLAGAILCGTLGAVPGLDEDAYDPAIQQLYTAATGPTPTRTQRVLRPDAHGP